MLLMSSLSSLLFVFNVLVLVFVNDSSVVIILLIYVQARIWFLMISNTI